MIMAKYFLDDVLNETLTIHPNEHINVSYEDLRIARPTMNYISMDGLGIDLYDDTGEFAISSDYVGYISRDVSDAQGNIDDTIVLWGGSTGESFEDTFFIEHGISFGFVKDYPEVVRLIAYSYDGSIVLSQDFEITSLNHHIDLEPFHCDRIQIHFIKTKIPNSFIKMSYLLLGNIYEFKDFKSFSLNDEVNLLGSDLPIGSVEFTVVNDNNIIGKEGNKVILYDNTDLLGIYYIKDVQQEAKNKYDFLLWNQLYKMDKIIYNNFADRSTNWKYKNVNAYEEMNKLFAFCGVKCVIDESLNNVWLTSYTPVDKSARYILQQMCFACNVYVDCWKKDYVEIKPIARKNYKIVSDSDNVILKTKINKNSQVKKVDWKIENYNYSDGLGKEENLFTISASELSKNIRFFEKPCNVNYVDWAQGNGNFEVTPEYIKVWGSETLAHVFGRWLSKTNFVNEICISEAGNKIQSISNCNMIGFSNENSLVSDIPYIEEKMLIQKYFEKPNTLIAEIKYNGESVGDAITIQTFNGDYFTGIIYSLVFTNSASNRKAEIEVKEWNL